MRVSLGLERHSHNTMICKNKQCNVTIFALCTCINMQHEKKPGFMLYV